MVSVSSKVTRALTSRLGDGRTVDKNIYNLVHGTLRELLNIKNKSSEDITAAKVVMLRHNGFMLHITWKDGSTSRIPFAIDLEREPVSFKYKWTNA